MDAVLPSRQFLRSKSGQSLLVFVAISALLSTVVGYSFYATSLSWFKAHKSEEKITALELVDAFVTNYSDLRAQFAAQAPVPATFRAHSIDQFNKQHKEHGSESGFNLLWVGREGRSIATPPTDEAMARTIEVFASQPDPKSQSEFLNVNGDLVFRTIYPSFAHEQSCVDCHNRIQPDQHWKLGDLMGAFSIDVPAGPFLATTRVEAIGLSIALFLAFGLVGLIIAILHFRQMTERERAVQSELARKERLSSLGQLTATVAHELRNPLSVIRNSLFAIKELAGPSATLERPLTRVERNVHRCDRIIADLLDFTRFQDLKRATVDADQWIEEILNEQRLPDGVVLRRRLRGGGRISLDPERMRRVVINLIENATQAMAESKDRAVGYGKHCNDDGSFRARRRRYRTRYPKRRARQDF